MRNCLLVLLFLVCSCMEENLTPESALKDFIETRFDSVVTRKYVLDRVTGAMKQSLENITDEEFNKFADLRNVKRDSFKILSKSCQEKRCFITYSISYQTHNDNKTTFNTEVKKIAEIVMVENKWLIADVSNIKTYHEATEAINPLE